MSEKKLVVLGLPWDVDTDGLKEYMVKFGDVEDCIVMKERSSGRSRGFGYVTFSSDEDAKKAVSAEHSLGNRTLDVKVAIPKEEMRTSSKKVTRIFVARISPSVTEDDFRSHFEKYGEITDLYMPKISGVTCDEFIKYAILQDPRTKSHRGIGFITFTSADSVDSLMAEKHELGGSTVVVDRASPKEEDFRPVSRLPPGGYGAYTLPEEDFRPLSRVPQGGYGAYDAYITAATRYAALGAPTMYDIPGPMYGRGESTRGIGRKIFVGRLPQEATSDDLRQYFGRFGQIIDCYVPKDPKRKGHRGFGFVTFAEDGVADRVARRSHEICGQQVAIDTAAPLNDTAGSSRNAIMDDPPEPYGGYGGPIRGYASSYGRMYGDLDFDDASLRYGVGGSRISRADSRYRPY